MRALLFPGGGIYYHWQAGAAKYIREHLAAAGQGQMEVIGASAGALASVLYASGADFDAAARVAIRQVTELDLYNSRTGLFKVWGGLVRSWLHECVPNDAAQLSSECYHTLHVKVTPVEAWRGPEFLSGFNGKNDAIEACMASVHIPFFLNGQACARYGGRRYLDGDIHSLFCIRPNYHTNVLPLHLSATDVYAVDRRRDSRLSKRCDITSSLSLITPEQLYYMMEDGYIFMREEAQSGHFRPNV